ncbi:helix-turn-helix domain-containing protein [Actinobacillus delphinicola]|uniref:Phage-associated protein, BcepMu gp16 family n=1 Tax=Actinobacillus delphinicola TaxID=51161 RepID=A0A448TUW3_9PAST|nr:DNA-binding protein [Actinobacillus delphinicola]VEJ09719.1 phage-associated protein, BcepMu gp16 family [Actinobacillus delphinicola]
MMHSEQKLRNAKAKIYSQGLTIKQWAEKNGFNVKNVYSLLNGERKGRVGKSLLIANKLGFYDED